MHQQACISEAENHFCYSLPVKHFTLLINVNPAFLTFAGKNIFSGKLLPHSPAGFVAVY